MLVPQQLVFRRLTRHHKAATVNQNAMPPKIVKHEPCWKRFAFIIKTSFDITSFCNHYKTRYPTFRLRTWKPLPRASQKSQLKTIHLPNSSRLPALHHPKRHPCRHLLLPQIIFSSFSRNTLNWRDIRAALSQNGWTNFAAIANMQPLDFQECKVLPGHRALLLVAAKTLQQEE